MQELFFAEPPPPASRPHFSNPSTSIFFAFTPSSTWLASTRPCAPKNASPPLFHPVPPSVVSAEKPFPNETHSDSPTPSDSPNRLVYRRMPFNHYAFYNLRNIYMKNVPCAPPPSHPCTCESFPSRISRRTLAAELENF